MPSPGDLCTWPRNPLLRDSKRRPVVVLSPACPGRSTALVIPLRGRHRPGSDIDLPLVAPGLSHHGRLRLMGALDHLLRPWSIDLSLQHELSESLRQHAARVGRRLMPG